MPISIRRFKQNPRNDNAPQPAPEGEAYEAYLPPGDQGRYFALAYSVRRVSQAGKVVKPMRVARPGDGIGPVRLILVSQGERERGNDRRTGLLQLGDHLLAAPGGDAADDMTRAAGLENVFAQRRVAVGIALRIALDGH